MKNGARPHFQTERWTRQLQNGARPFFQTERWTRQLQNGAWPHFLPVIARSGATRQSLK